MKACEYRMQNMKLLNSYITDMAEISISERRIFKSFWGNNCCRTCDYISRDSTLQGPQCAITIFMLSPVNRLAWYMPSLTAVAPPSTSAKQAGLLENASASISAAPRKACRDCLSGSILIQTDMPCKTYKSEGSCSAMETKIANARNAPNF